MKTFIAIGAGLGIGLGAMGMGCDVPEEDLMAAFSSGTASCETMESQIEGVSTGMTCFDVVLADADKLEELRSACQGDWIEGGDCDETDAIGVCYPDASEPGPIVNWFYYEGVDPALAQVQCEDEVGYYHVKSGPSEESGFPTLELEFDEEQEGSVSQ